MRLPLVCLALVIFGAVACGGEGATSSTEDADLRAQSIAPTSKERLPLKEVSGLGRRLVRGRAQYLAIGDADQKIVTFDVDGSRVRSTEAHDVSSAVGNARQWEAVAGDGKGRVFLLEEEKDRITVLDESLGRKIHTIDLDIGFNGDASRGEGMLLLENGHILIAKEKSPVAILEVAPAGEEATGFNADLALGDREFPLGRGDASELKVVHRWELGSSEASRIGDVSDLALDDENRILLLSDQGRAIVRIERTLDPTEEKIDAKTIFKLSNEVDKPEGLVLANGRPLVAIDKQDDRADSLFLFDRLR